MSKLQLELMLNIKQKQYVVKFPTNGQIIDISTLKSRLSGGQYVEMEYAATVDSLTRRAKKLIDLVAVFTILIPSIKEDINTKTLLDLPQEAMDELIAVYDDEFLPWYQEWLKTLENPKKDESQKPTS